MNSNIPRPTWRKPEPPKSFWQKFFTGLFGALGGFWAIMPIPKNIFSRPMSYFVRVSEQKPGEKVETKDSDRKAKEIISQDVSRQVAIWKEAADEEKDTVVYKVQSGDSLWKIAQNQYNWGERWIDIWTANRISIKEPNLIFAGQELKIPKQILRRTALFQSPALAPQKSAVKTAGGELMKNQINGNIVDARNYARQAGSITNFNSNSIDLSVRTLDLGRETIQLAQAAESIPSPTVASTTPTMAWSQDTAGNIIKTAPQSIPPAPAAPAPAPYGGAVLNTEQQVIYERLKSSRGVDAEIYKQTVLGSSPHVVAANAAVVKTDMGVVALNTSIASQTVGESVSAGPTHTSSVFQKSITAAAASVRVISGNSVLSETVTAEELNNFAQASATNAEAAVAANIVAPNSQAAASASESAGEAIAALQSINPAEVQQVLIAVANSANQEILNQGGDGAGNVPGPSSPGISSQGSDTSSSDSTSQTSFDTSVTGSTLSFQFGENTLGHITANPPSGIIGQGVANLTGSNVFGTIVNAGIGIVNLFAGVANTLIGVGVNLATDQETSISPFSFATTPQQAWSGLSGTQQGFQTQRAGEIASQNVTAATTEESSTAVPTTPTASEPSAPGYNFLSMQAKALGISISDVIGNLENTGEISSEQAANLRSIARAEAPAVSSVTPATTETTIGLAPTDVDTATSAEHGETGAVDDTSDITLGVQGVVGSAYSAVADMVANESATAAGMTSSEAGTRTSAEVAAQNASNPALAGGTAIGNSQSVTTTAGITGTVGIMIFGAAQQSAMTVTLSNGVTASFGMNAGTLASQGLTNEEGQQAMDLALAQTQQALNLMNQPRTITGIDDEGNTVTIDNPAAVPSPNPNINVTMDTPTGIMGEPGNVPSVDNPGAVAAQTSPNTNVSTDTPTGLMGQPTGNAPTGPTSADVDAAAAVDAANAAAGAVTGEPDAGPTSADGEGEGEGGGGAGGGEM